MADPALARWAQAIRAQLNFSGTVGVNCYVSPDGAGLPMHYDRRVATTLQIAGRKRWTFSTEAARPWPDRNATFKNGQIVSAAADPGTPPADMTFRTVELSPGDLLCLPAGAWHSARGIGVSRVFARAEPLFCPPKPVRPARPPPAGIRRFERPVARRSARDGRRH